MARRVGLWWIWSVGWNGGALACTSVGEEACAASAAGVAVRGWARWAGAGNARAAATGLVLLPGGGGACAWRGGCSARGWPAWMGRNRRMGWMGMKVG
jgi:hypothetical protein